MSIPSGAKLICRSAIAAGTLYTVPTGKRLLIASWWVSAGGQTTGGRLSLTADIADDANRMLVAAEAGTGASGSAASACGFDGVPVAAAGTVQLVNTGAAGGTFSAGFVGYEVMELGGAGEQ